MMTGRRRAALAVLLTAVTAVTGCTRPEESACGADGTGPITFATVKDLSTDQRDELTRRWAAGHPGQPLDIVELPVTSDEQRAQLAATLRIRERGGADRRDGYDVVGLDVVFLAEFARSDFLQPLVPDRFSGSDFLDVPWATSFADGELYAVPFTTNVGLLYYWVDDLVGMGVIPDAQTRWRPADWETVRRVARDSVVDERDGPAGYTGQLGRYEGLTANALELIWAEGGDLPTATRTAGAAELDGAARGLEFLLDGVRNRWIDESALGFDERDSLNAFASRKALIMRHWPDAWFTLAESGGPVGVTRLPGGGPAVLGGESLAVARCSPYRETAQQFISFLTDREQQKLFFRTGLYLPAVEGLYVDGSLAEEGNLPEDFVQLLHESADKARGRPADPAWNETSRVVQTEVHAALERSATETVDAEDVITKLTEGLG
jgi:multiple sugar transport system substrate-binding protein